MSTSLDQAVPRTRHKTDLQGWWLLLVGVAAIGVAYDVANRWTDNVPIIAEDSPGHDPPWYFIRQDAIEGICHLVAVSVSVLIAFVARKRYPLYANMLAWQSVLFNGGQVWLTIWILLNTKDLMTPAAATSRWPTFESYLHDPARRIGYAVVMVLAFALALVGGIRHRRSLRASQ